MLVCPKCQFENPNNHRFCQKCGTSLVDKPCPQCETSVSFTSEVCPNCGTDTGIRWRVLVAESITDSSSESVNEEIEEIKLKKGEYLDVGQRYRLLASENDPALVDLGKQGDYHFWQGRVIDGQPLQKSVLGVFLKQEKRDETGDESDKIDNKADKKDFFSQIGIPKLALPYLKLTELVPVIPEIHDAWQEAHREVILLSDRSQWQSLPQLIAEEPLPLLQIIYWLNQMVNLWMELAPLQCCQSLLIESNLRIDEDQLVGLGQLYPDSSENSAQIQDFAKMWQAWLTSSLQCQFEPLNALLDEVATENLTEIQEFKQKLEKLAESQQLESEEDSLPGEALDLEDLPELLREQLAEAEAAHPNIDDVEDLEDNLITSGPQAMLTDIEEGDDQPTAVLPMKLLSIHDAGLTDTGRQRRHNEDFFGMNTEVRLQQTNQGRKLQAKGFYIVCDGMGGHASGEVASAMAVETLTDYFQTHWQDCLPSQEIVREGIFLANKTIYEVNQQNATSGSGRMGTTLVLVLLQDTDAVIAHVGDSRIYRVNRKWGLEQLTVDHEVGQRAIQSGVEPEIAYARPDAYQLTQALGPHDNNYIQPDIRYLHLQEDTLLLLCSDGLSDNHLIENYWESHLQSLISAGQNLEMGLQKLITLGNEKNGHDNITAILVRIKVRPDLGVEDW